MAAWNKIGYPRPGCKCVATKNTRNIRNIQAPSQWKSPVWGVFLSSRIPSAPAAQSGQQSLGHTQCLRHLGADHPVDHRKIDVGHPTISKVPRLGPKIAHLTMRHVGFDAASWGSWFHLRMDQNGSEWSQSLDASNASNATLDDLLNLLEITRENPSNWRIPKGPSKRSDHHGDSPRAAPSSVLFALRSNRTFAIDAIGCEISISQVKWLRWVKCKIVQNSANICSINLLSQDITGMIWNIIQVF